MIKALKQTFKIRYSYLINGIIYNLKQIPIIKKIIPNNLYGNSGLNALGSLIAILIELSSVFFGKWIYVLIIFLFSTGIYPNNTSNVFITTFIFLTLAGALVNTNIFRPTKDKYYTIVLMHMNARLNVLSNYYYFLFKILIGLTPFVLIFGLLSKVSWIICLLIPILVIFIKIIVCAIYLKANKITSENKLSLGRDFIVALLFILVFLLPLLNIVVTPFIFYIIFIIVLISGILALRYINSYSKYSRLCKDLLKTDVIIFNIKSHSKQMNRDAYLKKIELSSKATSNKSGYSYFHDLFMKRHKSILMSSALKHALFCLGLIIGACALSIYDKNIASFINKNLLTFLPVILFIMYFINRGKVITTAMFMNCDHCMLTYHFYRKPKTILALFKERLKSLIKINMMSALVIACGLPILLLITGGSDNYLNYVIIFISVIAIAIFFSIHHLVVYYLLQPYNKDIEMKVSSYNIVDGITYVACYYVQQINMSNLLFGSVMCIFTIIYTGVALYLAYTYAPNTFKLKN